MRILIFALGERNASEGGAGTYIRTITKILQDRGHSINCLYHSDIRLLPEDVIAKIVGARRQYVELLGNQHPLLASIESSKYECMRVLEYLGNGSYDIIHSQQAVTSYAAQKIRPDVPLVGTIHGCYVSDVICEGLVANYEAAQIFRQYDEYAISCPTSVIAVSRSMDENLPPIPEEKLEVIFNGVDTDLFSPAERKNNPGSPVRIAASGRLHDHKGYDILMHALVILKEQGLEFEVTMFGSGPQKVKLENIVRSNQLPVTFRGEVSREALAAELPHYDIFVQPSRAENFPFSVIEAMACGCAPIVTRIGGMKEQVDHMTNGILCPPENVYALAESLRLLIKDRALREKMGQRAREKAVSNFSLEKMADRLEEVYRKTIEKHFSKVCGLQAS
ncbi:MAG: glycosyltransferase family 4 protein [Firmicutes bacterium]|nr:glycosyltransferase family 4 protein [Bacillota bacterium]